MLITFADLVANGLILRAAQPILSYHMYAKTTKQLHLGLYLYQNHASVLSVYTIEGEARESCEHGTMDK